MDAGLDGSSAWAAGLARRLRQPTLWAAFAALFLPYGAYDIWSTLAMPPAPGALGWFARLFTVAMLFFGWIWLGAVPWEWAWPPGRSRAMGKGVLASFLFCEAFIVLRVGLSAGLRLHAHEQLDLMDELLVNVAFLAPCMMLSGAVIARREISDREKAEFQQRAEEAQARLLQSQLHPHVLFNSLNGLAELTLKDPPRAERCIRALSDLLRKLLAASQCERLPLRAERELVADYLDLEALRLGERLLVEWDWDAELDACEAIPLLLQPLAENAIKHGIAAHLEGGVLAIEGRREGGRLQLRVRNGGAPLKAGDGLGLGLENLRSRLALAYGDAASVELRREGGWTLAELQVPWKQGD